MYLVLCPLIASSACIIGGAEASFMSSYKSLTLEQLLGPLCNVMYLQFFGRISEGCVTCWSYNLGLTPVALVIMAAPLLY